MHEDEFRHAALALPEAQEKSHFGKADFRLRDRIFAGFSAPGLGYVKLTPEQQAIMVEAEPAIFAAIPGGWGRKGWTHIALAACDARTLQSALTTAWRNVAPKTMLRAHP